MSDPNSRMWNAIKTELWFHQHSSTFVTSASFLLDFRQLSTHPYPKDDSFEEVMMSYSNEDCSNAAETATRTSKIGMVEQEEALRLP